MNLLNCILLEGFESSENWSNGVTWDNFQSQTYNKKNIPEKISDIFRKNHNPKISHTLEWSLTCPTTQTLLIRKLFRLYETFLILSRKNPHVCLKNFLYSGMDANQAVKLYPLILWDDCWFSLFREVFKPVLFVLAWKSQFSA